MTANEDTSFFIQDTWTFTPRWTLRVGIRGTEEYVAGGSPFFLPFTVGWGFRELIQRIWAGRSHVRVG